MAGSSKIIRNDLHIKHLILLLSLHPFITSLSSDTLDFSKLSLHHTKRMEMETLVKVLETEKQLETERSKLSELRKHHYKLAGEIEGWDQEVGASEFGEQEMFLSLDH